MTNLDSWDSYLSKPFLKAIDLGKESKAVFVVTAVEEIENEGTEKPQICLNLDSKSGKYRFGLNVSNGNFLRNKGIEKPNDCVGKIITLKKVMAFSPTAKKEVESLRICGVAE